MILADKIIKLRKKEGWSQEELADRLNISRQSVSKWESARSIPDLNKILMLSKIFGVSTDYLMKDEIEDIEEVVEDEEPTINVKRISLEQAVEYVEKKSETAKLTARGVFITMCSVIPLLFFLGLGANNDLGISENVAGAVGFVFMFLLLAIGVGFLVRTNFYNEDFEELENVRFELEYGVRGIFKERIKEYRPEYLKRVTIGVTLFITSVLPLITVAMLGGTGNLVINMVVILILIIGLGVYIMVPASQKYSALNLILGEGEYSPVKKKQTRKIEKLAAFFWPLVTAIYVGWSLWTMQWGITWVVWPVAGIGFVALIGLYGILEKDDEEF